MCVGGGGGRGTTTRLCPGRSDQMLGDLENTEIKDFLGMCNLMRMKTGVGRGGGHGLQFF